MNPRALIRTTAAILVIGFASVAGAQPDQKAPDAGSSKPHDRPEQSKGRGDRPAPAQGHAQGHAQGQPQGQPQARGQGHAQGRGPGHAQGRPQAPVPTASRGPDRRPMQGTPQRTAAQGGRGGQRSGTGQAVLSPLRNRQAPAPRQVTGITPAPRVATSHVEQQAIWPRYRAQSWNTQHRTWVQRGGYSGYRIPGASFGLYFGRPHRFHLASYRIRVVGGYPQFYADGFWFTIMDPVPEYWDDDWYDTDYVTIVQSDDGYYLLDESYPDAMVAVSVQIG